MVYLYSLDRLYYFDMLFFRFRLDGHKWAALLNSKEKKYFSFQFFEKCIEKF